MKTIDCESYNSTLKSASECFSLSEEELFEKLSRTRVADGYDVRSRLLGEFSTPTVPTTTCWFHASRVPSSVTFDDGVLPLQQSLPTILETLRSLATKYVEESQWLEFCRFLDREGQIDGNNRASNALRLFRMKAMDPKLGGPYGFLVREIIEIPKKIGNHDYLDTPEIVEDIADCFQDRFGGTLLDDYKDSTVPTIVKFNAPARGDELGVALFYLYSKIHNLELSYFCNTCFDGEGKAVTKSAVIGVENLDYP
jgi:hypothetical protein